MARAQQRRWGSVARRGVRVVGDDRTEAEAHRLEERRRSAPPARHEEVWVEEPDEPVARAPLGPAATASPRRAARGADDLPPEVVEEIVGAVGTEAGLRLGERLAAAAGAYERDRYQDALRITRALTQQVPESAAARELHGLACYRLGRWREAIRHLTEAAELAGEDVVQLPVVMDCYRALGRHRKVDEVWEELRRSSPPADVLVEGRLVLAEDLAERGRLPDAVALLVDAGAERELRSPADRHLRQWYVLADLCERAGDLPRARRLFARVVDADPTVADAGARLAALGGPPEPGGRSGERTVTLGELARGKRRSR